MKRFIKNWIIEIIGIVGNLFLILKYFIDKIGIEILQKGEYGVLSMCTAKNEGYGVPLNFALDNNKIYFHCAIDESKLDYLRINGKVSFCVVGNTEIIPSKFGAIYESAMVFGTTSEVEGEEKRKALMCIIEKYSGNYIQIYFTNSFFKSS